MMMTITGQELAVAPLVVGALAYSVRSLRRSFGGRRTAANAPGSSSGCSSCSQCSGCGSSGGTGTGPAPAGAAPAPRKVWLMKAAE